jgi:peptidoglycan DL-endopeptidase CwlO
VAEDASRAHRLRPARRVFAHVGVWTRFLIAAGLCVVTASAALATTTTPAQAEPTPEEIERQIDQAWDELEPLIEEHNATRIELEERRDEADVLADEIAPLQLQVDLAMAEVSEIAIEAYKGGPMSAFNALLNSGSPYTFADQLSALDQVAKSRSRSIAKVVEVKEQYEAEKAELDALVEQLTEEEAALGERAEEIDAEIDQLQELRVKAYGNGGGIGDLAPVPCPTVYPGGAIADVIRFACDQIGKPYSWGASGPGAWDCSGLTMVAWQQAGVSLPHNAAQQRAATRHIDRSELRPGDLIFYKSDLSHVGMYAGDGWMVHAPQSGQPVQMAPIDQIPIHSYGRP